MTRIYLLFCLVTGNGTSISKLIRSKGTPEWYLTNSALALFRVFLKNFLIVFLISIAYLACRNIKFTVHFHFIPVNCVLILPRFYLVLNVLLIVNHDKDEASPVLIFLGVINKSLGATASSQK